MKTVTANLTSLQVRLLNIPIRVDRRLPSLIFPVCHNLPQSKVQAAHTEHKAQTAKAIEILSFAPAFANALGSSQSFGMHRLINLNKQVT